MKLNELFPHFEERAGQEAMRAAISEAYEKDQTLLIEAGTGIGKTFAYLLPAVLWAHRHEERTIISTHTIALQQQLVDKDLPSLLERLNISLNIVLLKGMRHFHCLKKEEERLSEQMADYESCTHAHCPFYQQCGYFKQKRAAERADLIVVNHHLLLADLALRHQSDGQFAVLPEYDHVIIDEAHHLEEVATEHFAKRINRVSLFKLIGRMTKESYVNAQPPEAALSIPLKRVELLDAIDGFFRQLPRDKIRLTEDKRLVWQEKLETAFISERGAHFQEMIGAMTLPESEQRLMKTLNQQLGDQLQTLVGWLDTPVDLNEARWLEGDSVVTAQLDIAPFLQETLFGKKQTIILCSATLTAQQSFTYLKSRLGIEKAQEQIYESPFDYQKQTLLAVPNDLPQPSDPNFQTVACEWIVEAIDWSRGNAFVLFTSHQMMLACQSALQARLKKKGYELFTQGEMNRHELLEAFREREGAVLFGTDSFWEGVDVIGDQLRAVILTKLPFKMPSDPLFQARSEQLEALGKEPFMSYALPQAIVKFRQGFGRLIRHREDRGSVICLDRRLLEKGYGKKFFKSLPPCPVIIGNKEELGAQLKAFYTKS